ncbi:hypothetical protein E2C01_032299 [Portunus trituberculatus]|uniref:Endonuclease/exonuclease/phosphatase domain-containing protein n=1 Tax=Portunus trituberculatus TaxID=210409 RepID=A0A5B7F0Z9_PORTR|nr:hypothetical protein [Portunus trituberculatus]
MDVVVAVETFLDKSCITVCEKIPGYSPWVRRDRQRRQEGGIAVCHRDEMQVDILPVDILAVMEIVFLRVILADESGLLLCAAYRPQWQGNAPLNYLSEHLDDIMAAHNCQHVFIVGDLTVVQGLHNHVNFPTHQRGGSLDPVLSDLPEACVKCRPLDRVGNPAHYAVLSSINLSAAREEEQQRVIWLWERADWEAMKRSLSATDWHTVLTGDPHHDTNTFTTVLLFLQQQFVPHRVYTTNPKDQQWSIKPGTEERAK